MATATFGDITGNPIEIELPLPPGPASSSAARPVSLCTEDVQKLDALIALATTLVTQLPTIVGPYPMAESLSVTEASDSSLMTQIGVKSVDVTALTSAGDMTLIAAVKKLVEQNETFLADTNPVLTTATREADEYEKVAASQTTQTLGPTGGIGDYIAGVLIIPATTSPGSVVLFDNTNSVTLFTGGATSVADLVPFYIPLGMTSVVGAWRLTTGANLSCLAIGDFT